MIIALCIAIAVVAVLLSGFHSGSETGMYCVNRLRLRVAAERGDLRARRLGFLLNRDQNALSTLLIGTNVANYIATAAVATVLMRATSIGPGESELYTTLIVTPVIFVFGEVVPKNLFQRDADRLMLLGSGVFRVSAALFRIPVAVVTWVATPFVRLFAARGRTGAVDPRRRVAVLLGEAMAAEDVEGERSDLVNRVLELRDVPIHRVMVPRNRVVTLSASAGRKECLSLARKHPYSRFPVVDDHPRRVVGYVHVHRLLIDEDWSQVRERVRRIVTVDPHESVGAALVALQSAREAIAAVVDRNGYLLGIITLKDLVEELTGELHAW